jgi:hypothetical protein
MTIQGTIQGGLVVVSEAIQVPDGTPVTILVSGLGADADTVDTGDQLRRKAALAELLAMPSENPGDTFSGADHDQILYRDRQ